MPNSFFSYSGSNGKVPSSISAAASVKADSQSTNAPVDVNNAAAPAPADNNDHNDSASPSSTSHTSTTPSSTPTPTSSGTCKKARSLNKLQKRSKHARVSQEKRAGAYDQGQKDGVQAAKNFASFNMSKLGFSRQYILDKASSKSDDYANGFLQGLNDGEAEVQKAM